MTRDGVSQLQPGPHNPLGATPEPARRSMRRTWSIDMLFPAGLEGDVVADVRGRDLRTDADGTAVVVDELAIVMDIDRSTGAIAAVDATRASAPLDALQGVCVRGGLGRRLSELFAQDAACRSLCFAALEDLRGAQLVSGYGHLLEGIIPPTREIADHAVNAQSDICIGWAADGPFIGTTRTQGHIPVPRGPAAPDIGSDERSGWHDMAPLPPQAVRRRRRIDVLDRQRGGELRAQEHFRDSYAGANGEQVMHEYLVDAIFDDDGRLTSIDVDPRVLPWKECPGAAASAQQLVGIALEDLAAHVRSELVGATTCTHLNSTLRTLADVRTLARSLAG